MMVWEEIEGFKSLGEYDRFVQYIEGQVQAGYVSELEIDQNYGKGEIFGGRWFQDIDTQSIWRLIPPDIPFKGLWEPVEI
ncbi:MAG: hypothetical protein ACWA5R_08615 [bacterium]